MGHANVPILPRYQHEPPLASSNITCPIVVLCKPVSCPRMSSRWCVCETSLTHANPCFVNLFRSTYELSMMLSLSLLSPHTWSGNEVKFSPNLKLVCLDDLYPQISIKDLRLWRRKPNFTHINALCYAFYRLSSLAWHGAFGLSCEIFLQWKTHIWCISSK